MIHIEGMGCLGSLLALKLAADGVPFTWNDSDSPITAWKASTGMVYPAGDHRSIEGLAGWGRWVDAGWLPKGTVEEVRYVYHHKNPPHEGRYTGIDLGDMRMAPRHMAYAVNVPNLVSEARSRFADSRHPKINPKASLTIRAHGFTERLGKYMWGWSCPVALDVPARLKDACEGVRPSFYSRRDRFQIVYAYAIPSTPWWWAGSSIIGQTLPRHLDPVKHFRRWLDGWRENFPRVPVVSTGEPQEGWRPRPLVEPADDELVLLNHTTNVVTFPPLWHSGVRWAPLVIDRAVTLIGALT